MRIRCTLSATWTDSPTLNQARLTDAGQSAWNLRVTCPRRPPLRLNHRLPLPSHALTSSPTCQPPPLLPSCPFLPVRGIYTGEAGFDLAEYAAATDDARSHLRRAPPADTPPLPHPSSSSLLVLQETTLPLINGPAHFARSDATKNYTLLNTDELLAGTAATLFFLPTFPRPPLRPR